MSEMVQVAIISGLCTAIPSLIATTVINSKNKALLEYRLGALEKKMDKHNSVIERTYILEEKVKVANHRIEDLEDKSE